MYRRIWVHDLLYPEIWLKFTMKANNDYFEVVFTNTLPMVKINLTSPLSPEKQISLMALKRMEILEFFYRKATYGPTCIVS